MAFDSGGESSKVRRIAVIGGGLSGLAAAHRLVELSAARNERIKLTLFEAGEQFGGLVQTVREGEYLVELGADSFITNKPAAIRLCERLGLGPELIPTEAKYRRSQVLFRGKPHAVPEGFQLLTPASIRSFLFSPLFSLRGKLRMGWELFVPPRREEGDESLSSFVTRRFGQEALDRLVQPMVGGIYTSDPRKLSLAATMPRFLEMEQKYGSLLRAMRQGQSREEGKAGASGARYGLFVTLRNGMSELTSKLVSTLQGAGVELRMKSPVTRLSGNATGFQVETQGGAEDYDGVIVALPAYRAAELVSPFAAELAGVLNKIEYASSAIVVSGHKLADIRDPLDAFGLVIPAVEKRKILAVSYSSRKFPGRAPEGRVILRTFVGGDMQPELFDLSDAEMEQMVKSELREILGVSGKEDFFEIARYPRSMPQFQVGHLERVKEIRKLAAAVPRFALAGNAYDGVGVPDTIASGEQAAESVLRGSE
ncbi:MAG: protoporphyrinogen oxidase [Planctomycetales bacterium]